MQLIKKLKDTSISTAQLIVPVFMFSIASCQEACKDRSSEAASMTMEIGKCTLKGSDTTIRVAIKNNGENVASLDNFCLRASIAEIGGTGSILAYTDADNNANKQAKIDEPLTHFTTEESLEAEESVTIELQVKPGASASQATITLELYDKNKEETVATKIVTWSVSYQMSFISIPDPAEVKDNEEIQFQIKNEEDEVSTADITLCLNNTEGVEFDLNGKKGDSIEASLADILGSANPLAQGELTGDIILKLADAQGKQSSEITLELKQAGTSLTQKTVTWSATSYQLSFIGIPDPAEVKDNEEIQFQIKNEGGEVSTADITLCLNNTEGVEFDLNGKKGDSIEASLADILGGASTLAQGDLTNDISLKLADAQGKQSSEITLELKQAGTSLTQKTVTWSATSYQLSFIGIPDPAEVKDNEEIQFQIKNEGGEVSTADITVCLNNTEGVEFDLNGKKGDSIEASLADILGGASTLAQGDLTNDISLKLADAQGKQSSEITLELKQAGTSLAQKTVTWSATSHQMSFISIPDPAELKDNEEIQFQIKNEGDEVSTADITLCLNNTEGVEFDLNGKKGDSIEASLAEILGGASTLAQGELTGDIILKLADAQGKQSSEITLDLRQAGTSLAQKTVTWSATSYQLSFIGIPDPAEVKDNEEIQFQIKNEGGEVSTADITVCLNNTEGVEFDLNGKKGDSIEASLADILGSANPLAQGELTGDIILKLADAQGKQSSEITLDLRQAGTSLAQKTVTWSATSYQLSFIGIPDPAEVKDNEEIQFQIKNEGGEVSTADITVCLNNTEGIEFDLNGKKGDSIEASLADILGSANPLAQGELTGDIILKLADAQGKQSSEITLDLKQAGTSLAQKTVTWSATSYQLSFIGIPDPAEVKDNEEIQFQIKNEGGEVSTADITVCLNNTEGIEFELNGKKGASIEASLADILGSASTLAQGDLTNDISLKLADAQGKQSSEITLDLKQAGTSLAQKTVTWSATSYQLSFIGIPDPAEVKDNEEIQFQIKNEGDEVSTADITVCLNSTEGVEFDLNGKKGDSIEASLADILGSASTLAQGDLTNDISLKLADAQGKQSSTITLDLRQAGTSLAQKTVTWSATSYQLSFIGIPDPAEVKDNEEIQFQIKNEEDEVSTADITLCLNNTEGIEFELNGKKGDSIEASLADILGSASTLAQGDLTGDIILKLADAQGKNSSTITLDLKQAGTSLAQKTVKWSGQGLRLHLHETELYDEDKVIHGTLIGVEECSFDEVSVECKIVKKKGKEENNPTVNVQLDKAGSVTINIDPKKKQKVTLHVQLQYNGKDIGEPQEVTWQKSSYTAN